MCLSHDMGEVCVNHSGANVLFQLTCSAENKRVLDFPGQVVVTHYGSVESEEEKNEERDKDLFNHVCSVEKNEYATNIND